MGNVSRLASLIVQRAAPNMQPAVCVEACSTSGRLQSAATFQWQLQTFRHAAKASIARTAPPHNPVTLKRVTQPETISARLEHLQQAKNFRAVLKGVAGMEMVPSALVAAALKASATPTFSAGKQLSGFLTHLQGSMDVLLHTYTTSELVDSITGLSHWAKSDPQLLTNSSLIGRSTAILLDRGASLLAAEGPEAVVSVAEGLAKVQHSNQQQWEQLAGVVAKQAAGKQDLKARAAAALEWAAGKFPDSAVIKAAAGQLNA